MKGMTTCKVCERDFPLIIEEHYVAQDPEKVGALANIINTDRAFEFDAFDCPWCGCQNVMQGRKHKVDDPIDEEEAKEIIDKICNDLSNLMNNLEEEDE